LLEGTVGRITRRFEIALECFAHLIALLIGFFLGGDRSCNKQETVIRSYNIRENAGLAQW
jgi:hypothetical protein